MPRLISITNLDDPRIEPYRAIRERDLVGREGRFVAEGAVVLRILLTRSRFTAESVLLAEGRQAALAAELANLPAGTPVYLAPQPVLDAIAGFHLHRGMLAVGLRGLPPDPAALIPAAGRSRIAVAVGIANHDNLGGIFRNAAAFGFDAVLLDETCCDPLYRKAIRVSVGAALIVPFARAPIGTLLDGLEASSHSVFGLSPSGPETLETASPPPRAALLVGSEGAGLPPEVLARVRALRIPMAPGFDSLNAATAAGIAFHAFAGDLSAT